jgi:molybdenum cofactor cytidylyltransferase
MNADQAGTSNIRAVRVIRGLVTPRYFAILPAAGHSTRMGAPKLLLPLGGEPLIAATIRAWRQSRVDHVLVVVRCDDAEVQNACRQAGATIVSPDIAPPDMKASIQAALRHIEHGLNPSADDAFLVAPADIPRLGPAIIDRLIEQHAAGARREILVPDIAGQRGHPVLFPWQLAADVYRLGESEGLSALVDRGPLKHIPCDDLISPGDEPFADIDTPADYKRLT